MSNAPLPIPVRGALNTADPATSVPAGTLVDATDLAHRHMGPRMGYGRAATIGTSGVGGSFRQVLLFDGAANYVHYEPHAEQQTLGLTFTIDLLFQFDTTSSGDTTLFCHDADGATAAILISLLGTGAAASDRRKVKAVVRTYPSGGAASAAVTLTGTTQLTVSTMSEADNLHHVRLKRNGANLSLVVDGTEEATSSSLSATENIGTYSAGITIGRNNISSANTYFKGAFYRVAILPDAVGTDKRENAYHDWRHTRGQRVQFYFDGSITPRDFFIGSNAAEDRSRFHNYGGIGGAVITTTINTPSTIGPSWWLNLPVNCINRFVDRNNRAWNVVVNGGWIFQKRAT